MGQSPLVFMAVDGAEPSRGRGGGLGIGQSQVVVMEVDGAEPSRGHGGGLGIGQSQFVVMAVDGAKPSCALGGEWSQAPRWLKLAVWWLSRPDGGRSAPSSADMFLQTARQRGFRAMSVHLGKRSLLPARLLNTMKMNVAHRHTHIIGNRWEDARCV